MTKSLILTKATKPTKPTKPLIPPLNMAVNTLPGIVKIQMVRCEDLPEHLMLLAEAGAAPVLALPAVDIPFFGFPSLKWDGSILNGARQEQSTLEFKTTYRIPDNIRFAFVVTTAAGRQYLIGTREPKYPQIKFSDTTGAPDGDAALRTYKITHLAAKSVLPCLL